MPIGHLHLLLNIGISSCQVKDQRVPEINIGVILGTDEHLDILYLSWGFIPFEPFNMLVHTFRRSLQHGPTESARETIPRTQKRTMIPRDFRKITRALNIRRPLKKIKIKQLNTWDMCPKKLIAIHISSQFH